MEEFFEKGTIPDEHLVPGLSRRSCKSNFPGALYSGLGNIGTDRVLDFIPNSCRPRRAS